MRTLLLLLTLSSSLALAEGWQVRQVEINHIQVGNANSVFMTLSGPVRAASGCDNRWGDNWVTVPLEPMTDLKKHLINFATVANTTKQKVDLGGTVGNCQDSVPVISFIRVGDYTKN